MSSNRFPAWLRYFWKKKKKKTSFQTYRRLKSKKISDFSITFDFARVIFECKFLKYDTTEKLDYDWEKFSSFGGRGRIFLSFRF